ncbi:radical SAM protein [Ketobacter sp. MCCC 1A13808]|uniref:radical SAM/SPASM domain-containing protein n=1 Tax=Ketobacter sp. MCCC 1A13808 TaxID=2602738 RepID=UPI0012EBA027|nr:radical SAM protein [Ketobacter sp. MCCC 1A13808]MVF11183.1 radical SAM protein [Ketobacter sp. MCCC 1A13808]
MVRKLKLSVRLFLFRLVNWVSRRFFASRLSFSHVEAFLFNNSFRKFINFLHAHYEKYLGKTEVKSFPYLFVFEVTNVCNLKCPFCLTGKGISGGRDVRHMSFDEAKKIIDQVGEYIYMMQLYTWGEPLLNKDIYRIIEYAKSKNIFVMISTNATMLNKVNSEKLVNSGIDYVMVAVDGGSNETYEKYRVGGNYEKVLENVKNLVNARRTLSKVHPFVEWQFIVFRHNEHEVKQVEAMCYEMGVNKFTPLPAYVEDESWLPVGDEYKVEVFNPERLMNCDRPWTHLNVRADDGVAPCCYEFKKEDDFGTLVDDAFRPIWNNHHFRTSRKLIVQKRKGLEVDKEDIICYECLTSGIRPSFIDSPVESSDTGLKIAIKNVG